MINAHLVQQVDIALKEKIKENVQLDTIARRQVHQPLHKELRNIMKRHLMENVPWGIIASRVHKNQKSVRQVNIDVNLIKIDTGCPT